MNDYESQMRAREIQAAYDVAQVSDKPANIARDILLSIGAKLAWGLVGSVVLALVTWAALGTPYGGLVLGVVLSYVVIRPAWRRFAARRGRVVRASAPTVSTPRPQANVRTVEPYKPSGLVMVGIGAGAVLLGLGIVGLLALLS